MFNDKDNIMFYIKKHDKNLKDYDYAIPLNYSKKLHELDVNTNFYMTLYYKNSYSEVINILDKIVIIYNNMLIDYINNFLTFDNFCDYYNLDKKEIYYIESLLQKREVS